MYRSSRCLSPSLRTRRWVATLALGTTLGCELNTEVPEEVAAPVKVRKLYPPPEPIDPAPSDEPRSSLESVDDASDLKAALLGAGTVSAPEAPPPPPTEAAAPKRSRRRRRMVRTPEPPPPEPTEPRLGDAMFQSVITDWGGMKRCLASDGKRWKRTPGALQVAFRIRGDGHVVRSRVVNTSSDLAKAIAPCVERRARRIRFPAFAASTAEVEKTAKFVF